jgi:predicted DNA-binding transcriptional regulator YafY
MGPASYSKIVRALSFIRNQKYGATIGALMEHLECSRSTVERILQELKNSGFDLVDANHSGDDHRTKRWSLAREGLLSNPAAEQLLSLTLDERLALEQTYRITSDPALKDGLSKVLALQASLPRAREIDLDELVARDLRSSSVGPKQRVSAETLETLRIAMIGGSCLNISYNGGPARLVMPHGIVRNRFHYLVASSEDEIVRTYRIDLISSVTISDEMFDEPEDWSFADWVGASFGIFHGDATVTAILEFDASVAPRAESLVFHPSQWQKRQDDGSLLVHLRCCGHRELLHEILHPDWLGRVRVLGPPELVKELDEFLKVTQEKNGLS